MTPSADTPIPTENKEEQPNNTRASAASVPVQGKTRGAGGVSDGMPPIADGEEAPIPDGMTELQEIAWIMLSDGASYMETAKRVGRSKGTVGAWIKKWKKELDNQDLFHTPRLEQARKLTATAKAAADRRWADERELAALRFGLTSGRIVNQITQLLDDVGNGTLTGRDIKDLSLAAAIFADKAELLIGNPTSHARRSVPMDQFIVPPAPEQERTPEATAGMIINMMDRIEERKQTA